MVDFPDFIYDHERILEFHSQNHSTSGDRLCLLFHLGVFIGRNYVLMPQNYFGYDTLDARYIDHDYRNILFYTEFRSI
jgi:hypothetical protein